ncbi:ABC transporter permease subunit [Enterocloster sp.]|uniref:ABC transporter permease subunit n=1 Tax=Enterocloster sp. TaxID=2719315 RepID=UPI00399FD1C5
MILIICYLLFNIPFTILMMRGFFEDIPMEIEEAGKIDGCNGLQVFKELILPCASGLTATAIFCPINSWNEFVCKLLPCKTVLLRSCFCPCQAQMGRDGGNRCPFQSGYPLWDNCQKYDTRFNIWCSEG